MSVDWTGQWALLAGRRHLALQSLDLLDEHDGSGTEGLQKFYRNSKYEVSAAEWAICEGSQEYCAIATSQLIEVILRFAEIDCVLITQTGSLSPTGGDMGCGGSTANPFSACSHSNGDGY